jgi:hypothetical protein
VVASVNYKQKEVLGRQLQPFRISLVCLNIQSKLLDGMGAANINRTMSRFSIISMVEVEENYKCKLVTSDENPFCGNLFIFPVQQA